MIGYSHNTGAESHQLYLADLCINQWKYWSTCMITTDSAAESTNTILSPPQGVSTCLPQGDCYWTVGSMNKNRLSAAILV